MEEISQIDVNLLQPNPLQPRGLITPDSLNELTDSIREHGVLEPLVVAKTPAGFQIIAGERRWRAAKLAGLRTVPAVVKETTPTGMLEMAIVENVQRVDLNPIERAQAFKRLLDEFGLTTGEIAKRISKSQSFVSNSLRLLTLPDALKDALATNQTTEGHVRALAALDDPKLIIEGYKIVLQKNLSVRGAEELARKWKSHYGIPQKAKANLKIANPQIDDFEKGITEKLESWGVKPKVKFTQSRVQGRMNIFFSGPLEKTNEIFSKIYQAITGI